MELLKRIDDKAVELFGLMIHKQNNLLGALVVDVEEAIESNSFNIELLYKHLDNISKANTAIAFIFGGKSRGEDESWLLSKAIQCFQEVITYKFHRSQVRFKFDIRNDKELSLKWGYYLHFLYELFSLWIEVDDSENKDQVIADFCGSPDGVVLTVSRSLTLEQQSYCNKWVRFLENKFDLSVKYEMNETKVLLKIS